MPIKIFLSYSHKDSDIKEELDIAFAPLKRSGKAQVWHDGLIQEGTEWNNDILQQLEEADIILLLISNYFIASNYIWEKELSRAMERHEAKTARVIPIFAKKCDFQDMPFAKLQGLPRNAKPINTFDNPDEAYTEIVKAIRNLMDNSIESKPKLIQNKVQVADNEQIKELVVNNQLKEAIEALRILLANDKAKSMTLLMNEQQYNQLLQDEMRNIISPTDAALLRNKLIYNILSLLP